MDLHDSLEHVAAMPFTPFVSVDSGKPKVRVDYTHAQLPSVPEIHAAFHLGAVLHHKQDAGAKQPLADATLLVDVCMRFTCLAYRRNLAHGKRRAAVTCESCDGGVEVQVNAKNGAHACVYLFRIPTERVVAVVAFKGSTANHQDWLANFALTVSASKPIDANASSTAFVHPGWLRFLDALVDGLDQFELRHMPAAARAALALPAASDDLSLWRLLSSAHLERVLLVGHSLGGALACLAATRLGVMARAQAAQAQATQAPGAVSAAALVPATSAQPPSAESGCPSSGGGDAPSHEAQLLDATLGEAQDLLVMEAEAPAQPPAYKSVACSIHAVDESMHAASIHAVDESVANSSTSSAMAAPLLVTFGCPIVGNASFVALQNAVVAPAGGLRIFNRVDPVASVGSGFFSGLRKVPHAGLPIELSNHFLLRANPLLNHLTYVIDSFGSILDAPCSRACYVLPGLNYSPDRHATERSHQTHQALGTEHQAEVEAASPARRHV